MDGAEPRLLRHRGPARSPASSWPRKWLLGQRRAPDAWWHFFLCGIDRHRSRRSPSSSSRSTTPSTATARCRRSPKRRQTGPATNIIAGIAVGIECTVMPVIAISIAILSLATSSAARAARDAGAAASSAPPSRPWACSGPPATSWRWTPSARSPTTPAASSRCPSSPKRSARRPTPRLGRQHDQGADQGLRHRLRGARGLPALLGVPRRSSATITGTHAASRQPRQAARSSSAASSARCWCSSSRRSPSRPSARRLRSSSQEVRRQFKERPGHHAGHREAGLRPLRRHRDASARCRQMVAAGRCWPSLFPIVVGLVFKHASAVGAEAVAALLMVGTIAGILMATLPEQRRRRLGQRQEVHRDRASYGGKGSDAAQGGRRRRHRRRSVQGHRRPVAARADQAAGDDHARARAAVHLSPAFSRARAACRAALFVSDEPAQDLVGDEVSPLGEPHAVAGALEDPLREPALVVVPQADVLGPDDEGGDPLQRHPARKTQPEKDLLPRDLGRDRPARRAPPAGGPPRARRGTAPGWRRSPACARPRARGRTRRGRASARAASTSRCAAPRGPGAPSSRSRSAQTRGRRAPRPSRATARPGRRRRGSARDADAGPPRSSSSSPSRAGRSTRARPRRPRAPTGSRGSSRASGPEGPGSGRPRPTGPNARAPRGRRGRARRRAAGPRRTARRPKAPARRRTRG